MTGTPVANRPYDVWSQIYFLDLGKSLGKSFEEFKSEMDFSNQLKPNSKTTTAFENRLASLYEKIKKFTVRETKGSAGISLPQKDIRNTPAELESAQHTLYESYRIDAGSRGFKKRRTDRRRCRRHPEATSTARADSI